MTPQTKSVDRNSKKDGTQVRKEMHFSRKLRPSHVWSLFAVRMSSFSQLWTFSKCTALLEYAEFFADLVGTFRQRAMINSAKRLE
jgi:hypothetical protein